MTFSQAFVVLNLCLRRASADGGASVANTSAAFAICGAAGLPLSSGQARAWLISSLLQPEKEEIRPAWATLTPEGAQGAGIDCSKAKVSKREGRMRERSL